MTSELSVPNRRTLLAIGLACVFAPWMADPATASPPQRAQDLVAQLSREMLALINAPRPERELYAEFEGVVAQATLGPPWRGATPAQRTEFVRVFQAYLARKYGRQFRDFQQSGISLVRVRDAGNAGVLVETRITRPRQQDIALGWQISERSGGPRVVNLIFEGISMIAAERAEIGALLESQRGSIEGLIQALRSRT
jgi:phospholipid transport system substrate-binding protein